MSIKVITKQVPVVVTTFKPEVDFIELKLTPEEFTVLAIILQNIGGCPVNSPRHYTNGIMQQIHQVVGVNCFEAPFTQAITKMVTREQRAIYFKDGLDHFRQTLETVKTSLLAGQPQ